MPIVKILNSNQQNLAAVIHEPLVKTEKLAILCPGFLDTKDYDHLVKLAETLANEGYTVVRFDPTGTWESEGDISQYTTSQYLRDINSVLEYMLKDYNYERILLGGHSRGGQLSILFAARDSRISVVLCIMGSSGRIFSESQETEWKNNSFNISYRDIPGQTGKREFKVPYSHVKDRDQYDVVVDVKNVHVPILFIAGENDVSVFPEYVQEIFVQANNPKKFIIIPSISHDYRRNLKEVKVVNKIIINQLKIWK